MSNWWNECERRWRCVFSAMLGHTVLGRQWSRRDVDFFTPHICGIQDVLITKRVSSDVMFANIYSGILIYGWLVRAVYTARMYGWTFWHPYIRAVHTAHTYGPYVRVVRIGFKVNTTFVLRFIGRPFVKRFALCYRTVVCPVYLCVTLVYCGQTIGWIKIPLGIEVGLGPGHTVLHEDLAPPTDRGTATLPPLFGPCLLWPNGRPSPQLLSSCNMCDTHF